MTDYKKYINALRKCAKEHKADIIFTGHTDVTALCRDTADLLEEIEKDPCENCSAKHELEINVKKWADAYKRGLEDRRKEQSCKDTNSVLNTVFKAIDDCNSDGLTGIFCSYDDGERLKEYIKNKIESEENK